MNNSVPLKSSLPGTSGTSVPPIREAPVQLPEKGQPVPLDLEQISPQAPGQNQDFKALFAEMTRTLHRQMQENQEALLAQSEKRIRDSQKAAFERFHRAQQQALEEQRQALKKQELASQQLIAKEAVKALAKQQALEA